MPPNLPTSFLATLHRRLPLLHNPPGTVHQSLALHPQVNICHLTMCSVYAMCDLSVSIAVPVVHDILNKTIRLLTYLFWPKMNVPCRMYHQEHWYVYQHTCISVNVIIFICIQALVLPECICMSGTSTYCHQDCMQTHTLVQMQAHSVVYRWISVLVIVHVCQCH